jgi:hypothetical protein
VLQTSDTQAICALPLIPPLKPDPGPQESGPAWTFQSTGLSPHGLYLTPAPTGPIAPLAPQLSELWGAPLPMSIPTLAPMPTPALRHDDHPSGPLQTLPPTPTPM